MSQGEEKVVLENRELNIKFMLNLRDKSDKVV